MSSVPDRQPVRPQLAAGSRGAATRVPVQPNPHTHQTNPRIQMNPPKLKWSLAALLMGLASLSALAGTVSFSTSTPTPGAADLYNFTVGATDPDNVFAGADAGT